MLTNLIIETIKITVVSYLAYIIAKYLSSQDITKINDDVIDYKTVDDE